MLCWPGMKAAPRPPATTSRRIRIPAQAQSHRHVWLQFELVLSIESEHPLRSGASLARTLDKIIGLA